MTPSLQKKILEKTLNLITADKLLQNHQGFHVIVGRNTFSKSSWKMQGGGCKEDLYRERLEYILRTSKMYKVFVLIRDVHCGTFRAEVLNLFSRVYPLPASSYKITPVVCSLTSAVEKCTTASLNLPQDLPPG